METSARNPLSEKIFFVPRLFVGKAGRALTLALAASTIFPIQAQTSTASPQKASATAAKGTMIPRTPWGAPDLNGVWNGNTMTPLERWPGDPPFLTKEKAEALEKAQGEISQFENRPDHMLSTLRAYVRALGGKLEVIARFGDKSVRLRDV